MPASFHESRGQYRDGGGMLMFPSKQLCLIGEDFYTNKTKNGIGFASICDGDSGGPEFYEGVQQGISEMTFSDTCYYVTIPSWIESLYKNLRS